MAGYCTLVLYFHSPAAPENTDAHSVQDQVTSAMAWQMESEAS